jgi:hypothetical protein
MRDDHLYRVLDKDLDDWYHSSSSEDASWPIR